MVRLASFNFALLVTYASCSYLRILEKDVELSERAGGVM